MRAQILENLQIKTIHKLVCAFDERRTSWYPSTFPGLEESINHSDNHDMLSKADLIKRIAAYGEMLQSVGQDPADFESFPAYFAFCNVDAGFNKFKAQQIAMGAENVFGNGFSIFLAHGIHSLFLSFSALPGRYSAETGARLVECSFKDDFFEKLLDYVYDAESLAVVGDAAIETETIVFCQSETYDGQEG